MRCFDLETSDRQRAVLFFAVWLFIVLSATILNRFVLFSYLGSALGLGAILAVAVVVCIPLLLLSNYYARKSRWKVFSIITLVLIIHHLLAVITAAIVLIVTVIQN